MTVILAPVGSPTSDELMSCAWARVEISVAALITRATETKPAAMRRSCCRRIGLMCRGLGGTATLEDIDRVRVERASEQIPLCELTAEREELVALLSVLDAFGDGAQVERIAEGDDRTGERGIGAAARNAIDE